MAASILVSCHAHDSDARDLALGVEAQVSTRIGAAPLKVMSYFSYGSIILVS